MYINKIISLIFLSILTITSIYSQNVEGEGKKMEGEIFNYSVKDAFGETVEMSQFKGKVLLIVNVACKCGYTKQYEGLQELYEKYKTEGFEILAFPCNDFGGQEPGTIEEIQEFCSSNFGVTFTLFEKIKVLGDEKEPMFAHLTDNPKTGSSDIGWNFEKFLISKKGEIVARYRSAVEPLSDEIVEAVKLELSK